MVAQRLHLSFVAHGGPWRHPTGCWLGIGSLGLTNTESQLALVIKIVKYFYIDEK